MRTREEIIKQIEEWGESHFAQNDFAQKTRRVQLEVLLDIRDLLIPYPPREQIDMNQEALIAAMKLRIEVLEEIIETHRKQIDTLITILEEDHNHTNK